MTDRVRHAVGRDASTDHIQMLAVTLVTPETVVCTAIPGWIATAIALARPKSRKKNSLTRLAMAIGFGVTGNANAACGLLPPGSYTAIQTCAPGTGDASITTQPVTSVVVNSGGGAGGIAAQTASGNATISMEGTTVDLTGSTVSNGAVYASALAGGDAAVTLSGTNSITTNANQKGVLLSAGGGNGSLNITGSLILNNVGDSAATKSGLEVDAAGATSAISHMGTGTITTHGGSAVMAAGTGTTTNTSINLGSGVALVVDSTNSGALGARNVGIYSSTVNGSATIINAATITTYGNNASGILANSTGTGSATITNSGDITINGAATVIRADLVAAGNTGNASITLDAGALKVLGNIGNGAVYAAAQGTGSAMIVMNGGSLENDSTSDSGHGLEAQARGTGDATVILNAGSVLTEGGLGIAVWGNGTGTGNATIITVAGTTVTAQGAGPNGGGLFARGGSATTGTSILVDSQSVIESSKVGIDAASSNGGAITIRQTGGSITSSEGQGIRASTAGAIDITNSATVQTTGGAASISAINVTESGSGTVDLANIGALSTASTGSRGIVVTSNSAAGSGDVTISNTGTITTTASASETISASTAGAANKVIVSNTATLTTNGSNSYGIHATTAGGGVVIANSGAIDTTGTGATGLQLATSGGVIGVTNTNTISATGSNASGIFASTNGTAGAGDIDVDSRADITAANNAIWVEALQGGHVNVTAGGDFILTGNVTAPTNPAHGIAAFADGAAYATDFASVHYLGGTIDYTGTHLFNALAASSQSGDASVIADAGSRLSSTGQGIYVSTGSSNYAYTTQQAGNATAIFNGDGIATTNDDASAIWGGALGQRIGGDPDTGNVTLANTHGTLSTVGNGSAGMHGKSQQGDVMLANGGAITTQGTTQLGALWTDRAAALYAQADAGKAGVQNTGTLSTQGTDSPGILAVSGMNAAGQTVIDIINRGAIATYGVNDAQAIQGIASGSGNILIDSADADLATHGGGANNHGVEANAADGAANINFSRGNVRVAGQSVGLLAWNNDSGLASSAQINVAGATIDATNTSARAAVQASAQDSATLSFDAASQVHGGTGIGLALGGATQALFNAGTLDALSDRAIQLDANGVSGSATLTNIGHITGGIAAGGSAVKFDNAGLWTLRNFSASTAGGARDTLGVSVSDFGTSGNNRIDNTGTLELLTHDGSATTLDTSGMYLPFGNPNNAIALHSPTQGQLLGVQRFIHSGTIDLQANPSAGDVLVISGGHAAGVNGGGVFISNGGTLKLDTVLNEGGANSQSDMLVVDATRVGAGGPTRIQIRNLGGQGAMTDADGIALVEVLNKAVSAENAFKLDGRATAGAYEYLLYQGGVVDPADGNWYLRSSALPPEPEPEPVPPVPEGALYRPEVGAYLANRSVARTMFRHTLHDRLGEPDFTESQRLVRRQESTQDQNDPNHSALWVRYIGNHAEGQAGYEQLGIKTNQNILQIGGEIGQWTDGDSRTHWGLMGGYGQANSDSVNRMTGYHARGDVTGYSLGVYGTWYASASQATGLYLDSWLQYNRFDNRVLGDLLPEEKYKSQNIAASLEAGYAMQFTDAKNAAHHWYIEPQAQLVLTHESGGSHQEVNGTQITPQGKSDLTARLGARLYARKPEKRQDQVQPFLEINVWQSSGNGHIDFDGVAQTQSVAKTIGEVKVGVQSEFKDRWNLWAQLAYRQGIGQADSSMGGGGHYRDYGGVAGVKFTW